MRLTQFTITYIIAITQTLSADLDAAMKEAQTADKVNDVSTDVQGYKEAVDSLSACISECVGPDLLSESADVVVAARDLEGKMKAKLRKAIGKAEHMLRAEISTAETSRDRAPLAAYLETLVADEVLRESCGDAVKSAENLLAKLQAEEKDRITAVSVHVCGHIVCICLFRTCLGGTSRR